MLVHVYEKSRKIKGSAWLESARLVLARIRSARLESGRAGSDLAGSSLVCRLVFRPSPFAFRFFSLFSLFRVSCLVSRVS